MMLLSKNLWWNSGNLSSPVMATYCSKKIHKISITENEWEELIKSTFFLGIQFFAQINKTKIVQQSLIQNFWNSSIFGVEISNGHRQFFRGGWPKIWIFERTRARKIGGSTLAFHVFLHFYYQMFRKIEVLFTISLLYFFLR